MWFLHNPSRDVTNSYWEGDPRKITHRYNIVRRISLTEHLQGLLTGKWNHILALPNKIIEFYGLLVVKWRRYVCIDLLCIVVAKAKHVHPCACGLVHPYTLFFTWLSSSPSFSSVQALKLKPINKPIVINVYIYYLMFALDFVYNFQMLVSGLWPLSPTLTQKE